MEPLNLILLVAIAVNVFVSIHYVERIVSASFLKKELLDTKGYLAEERARYMKLFRELDTQQAIVCGLTLCSAQNIPLLGDRNRDWTRDGIYMMRADTGLCEMFELLNDRWRPIPAGDHRLIQTETVSK